MIVKLTLEERPLTLPGKLSWRIIHDVRKIEDRATLNHKWRVFITNPEGKTEWWDKSIIMCEEHSHNDYSGNRLIERYYGQVVLQVIDYGRAGSEYRIKSRGVILNFIVLESGACNEILGTRHLRGPGMTTRRIAASRIPYNSISGFPLGDEP